MQNKRFILVTIFILSIIFIGFLFWKFNGNYKVLPPTTNQNSSQVNKIGGDEHAQKISPPRHKDKDSLAQDKQIQIIIDKVIKSCMEQDTKGFNQAREALKKLGSRATQALSDLLAQGTSECEQYMAITVLGEINNVRAIHSLIDFIENPNTDTELKYKATRALAGTNNNEAANTVATNMNKPGEDEHLKVVSALALGGMAKRGNNKAIQYLIEGLDSSSPIVQYKCIQGLGVAQNNDAIMPLATKLAQANNRDIEVRIIETLGNFDNKSAIDVIIKTIDKSDDTFLKVIAIGSLERIGNKESENYLSQLLKSQDIEVQKAAQKALDNIGGDVK